MILLTQFCKLLATTVAILSGVGRHVPKSVTSISDDCCDNNCHNNWPISR